GNARNCFQFNMNGLSTKPPTSSFHVSSVTAGCTPRSSTGQFLTSCCPTGSWGMPCRLAGPVPCGRRPARSTFTAFLSSSICRWMYFCRRSTRSSFCTVFIVASVLSLVFVDNDPERGARMARREEQAYREDVSDEQRSQ